MKRCTKQQQDSQNEARAESIRDYLRNVATVKGQKNRNRPERLEWFHRLGLGMMITWGVDSQLGCVISHSLVGASDDYVDRFFHELPKTFRPSKFDPEAWAALAKLAGMKYVLFTAKHHSGFCMFETATTDYNVINTPHGKDITRQIVEAFRKQGLGIGIYFSPDDFHFLRGQGLPISRFRAEAIPSNNPQLMEYNCRQMRELMTQYGPIDVVFLDGDPTGLRELCWDLAPEVIVTRGAMPTPEQRLAEEVSAEPWEACFTLGTQWHFKPTNEEYKSGTRLIEMLIETRAKGGNLLINMGPTPDGEVPFEQERRFRELGLWNFINGEAVYNVVPWQVANESGTWFAKAQDDDTVYAFVTRTPWHCRTAGSFTLKGVRATEHTEIEVVGQSGEILEYHPDVCPRAQWHQGENGLMIEVTRALRIYNNLDWPNPVVIRITHARTPA